MALHGSGTIWLSQIRDEFGNWGPPNYLSHYYRGQLTTTNNTNVPASGPIYFSQFFGAVKATSGTRDYASPGSFTFTVPPFQRLRVRVWGGGGASYGGTAGTRSSFNGVVGNAGGTGGVRGGETSGPNVGGAGGTYSVPSGGSGGNGEKGGEIYYYNLAARAASGSGSVTYGGGSHGVAQGNVGTIRGLGGGGGYADYTFSPGQLTVGGQYTVTVGKGGTSPQGASYNANDGRVYIDWS
nr:MAG TPA: hypothetical protein [Caudoviricetes sp.]